MSKQSQRHHDRFPGGRYLPPFARNDYGGQAQVGWTYREVLSPSLERLETAANHVRGKHVVRVSDKPTFTLVYSRKLERLRDRSPLQDPPSVVEIARKFGQLELESIHSPVTARPAGLVRVQGALLLEIEYPGLHDELALMNRTVYAELGLSREGRKAHPYKVTPDDPHVTLLRNIDGLSQGERSQIESKIPDGFVIELSEVRATAVEPEA